MSAGSGASVTIRWRHTTLLEALKAGLLIAAGAVIAGCARLPPTHAGPDPADPHAAVAAVSYRPTISYQRQRPVEPGPWVEQNQRVTPDAKR